MGPGTGLNVVDKRKVFRRHRIRTPDRPPRSTLAVPAPCVWHAGM